MDLTNNVSSSVWPHFHSMNFYKTVALRSQPSGNINDSIATTRQEVISPAVNALYASAREVYHNSFARSDEPKSSNTAVLHANNIAPTDASRSVASNINVNKNDEFFFGNLLYWSSLVTGHDKLEMRIEMMRLIQSFVFENYNDESGIEDDTDKEFYNTLIPYTSRVINSRKMELQSAIINLLRKFAFYEPDQQQTGKCIHYKNFYSN